MKFPIIPLLELVWHIFSRLFYMYTHYKENNYFYKNEIIHTILQVDSPY